MISALAKKPSRLTFKFVDSTVSLSRSLRFPHRLVLICFSALILVEIIKNIFDRLNRSWHLNTTLEEV